MDDAFALPRDALAALVPGIGGEVGGAEIGEAGIGPPGVAEPGGAFAAERASRPHVTGRVTRGAARLLIGLGYAPLAEVPLPNGRRADLMAVDARGRFAIVEVKSGWEDLRCDQKWPHYAPFCDRFYFAVSPEFPLDLLPGGCGVIVADGFGGMVRSEAAEAPLAPARRKTLTLAFARLAALRATGSG